MVPVLILCLGGFTLAGACHLLAILGALRSIPTLLGWVLLIQMSVGVFLALFTHPKHSGVSTSLDLSAGMQPMSSGFRVAYFTLIAYALIAILVTVPADLAQRRSFSMLETFDAPFFFTVVVLLFSTAALMASHSGVLVRRHLFCAG